MELGGCLRQESRFHLPSMIGHQIPILEFSFLIQNALPQEIISRAQFNYLQCALEKLVGPGLVASVEPRIHCRSSHHYGLLSPPQGSGGWEG